MAVDSCPHGAPIFTFCSEDAILSRLAFCFVLIFAFCSEDAILSLSLLILISSRQLTQITRVRWCVLISLRFLFTDFSLSVSFETFVLYILYSFIY